MSTAAPPPIVLSWCPGKDPPDLCDPCSCYWIGSSDLGYDTVSGFNPRTLTGSAEKTGIGACSPAFAIECFRGGYAVAGIAGPPDGPVGNSVTCIWLYGGVPLFTASGLDTDSHSANIQDIPFAFQNTAYFWYTNTTPGQLAGSYHYTDWSGLPDDTIDGPFYGEPSTTRGGYLYAGPIVPGHLITVSVVCQSAAKNYAPAVAGSLYFHANKTYITKKIQLGLGF